MKEYLRALHRDYSGVEISGDQLDPNPVKEFEIWLQQAIAAGCELPNAMSLATAGKSGMPTVRTCLLADFTEKGFTFFTNYESRKGLDLAENPRASLLFFWPKLHRQIQLSGSVERVSEPVSDLYFNSRPRGSQLSAWASPQSRAVTSREAMEARCAELDKQYEGRKVPRPPHWGGYCLKPFRYEFWIGRGNRLHDRFLYERRAEGWDRYRLAP